MVMHARKQPRLDDGYKDKRDPHLYQSNQYPSKSHDDYRRRESGRSSRDGPSPRLDSPRYINKKSYIDKDKNRMERGTYNSPDRKYNHTVSSSASSSHHRVNSQNGSYDKGGAKSNPRDNRDHTQESRESRDSRDSRDSKEHKTEVQKTAIRSCGEWSEYIASSGKQYYYNHKTEVSQWEKPKEWNDRHAVRHDKKNRDSRGNDKDLSRTKPSSTNDRVRSSTNPSSTDVKRHSGLEFNPKIHSEKPDKVFLIKKFQDSQRQVEMERPNIDSERRTSSSSSHTHSTSKRGLSHDHSKSNSIMYGKETGTFIDHSQSASTSAQYRNRSRRDSEGTRSHHGHVTPRKHDDMDISPGSTPTNSRPSSSIGTPQIPGSTPASVTTPCVTLTTSIGSNNSSLSNLPQIINQLGGTQNNQEVTQQALQTLQKLQQLISQQIAQQRSSSSTVPSRNTVPLDNACHQQTHQTVTSSARLPGQQIHNAHHGHLTQYPPQHINNSQSVQCSPMNSHPHSHHPHSQGNTHSTMNSLSSPQTHVTSNHIVSSQGQLIVQNSLHHPQHHTMHTSMTDTNGARGNTVISSAPAHTGSVYGRVMNNQGQQSYAPLHVDTSNSVMVDRGGGGGERSPRMGGGAGGSPRSSCGSPSSTTSSQEHHPIGDQAVPAAGMNKTESPNIGPSHSNYYNDRLIGHVTGWQADHAQRQALRYWEEGINIGSFHCGQISVELKRARSLVRLAEIQSTLHEQRCMFLSQQIHELEGLKAPSFSSTSTNAFNTNSQ